MPAVRPLVRPDPRNVGTTMTEPTATLSAHLLHEAAKYLLYPKRVYRTATNLALQDTLDRALARLVEWRKTFAPTNDDVLAKWLFETPTILDQLYSRELLRAVPDIVERTRSLSAVTLSRAAGESFVYLREASNCFILGLPQAAVALARAAVEVPIRALLSKHFGATTVEGLGLYELLERGAKSRLLSKTATSLAHKVRLAADEVLHEQPTTTGEALDVLEAARRDKSWLNSLGNPLDINAELQR